MRLRFRFPLAFVALIAFAASAAGVFRTSAVTVGTAHVLPHPSPVHESILSAPAVHVAAYQPVSSGTSSTPTRCTGAMAEGMNHCPFETPSRAPAGPTCPVMPSGAAGVSCMTAVAMLPATFVRIGAEHSAGAIPPLTDLGHSLLLGSEFFRPPRA